MSHLKLPAYVQKVKRIVSRAHSFLYLMNRKHLNTSGCCLFIYQHTSARHYMADELVPYEGFIGTQSHQAPGSPNDVCKGFRSSSISQLSGCSSLTQVFFLFFLFRFSIWQKGLKTSLCIFISDYEINKTINVMRQLSNHLSRSGFFPYGACGFVCCKRLHSFDKS